MNGEGDVPKGVSDDEECDVVGVCAVQDGVAVRLDHVAVGEEDGFTVKGLLEWE